MIKINLALKKQAAGLGDAKGSADSLSGKTKLLISDLKSGRLGSMVFKEPALRRLVVSVVAVVAMRSFLEWEKEEELGAAQAELVKLTSHSNQTKKDLERIKELEAVKKILEGDELNIRKKIQVVKSLTFDREMPPRMLLLLSETIPKDVWLSKANFKPDSLEIEGLASGISAVSEFMRNLGEVTLIKDVELKGSKVVSDPLANEVTSFSLIAKRR